MSGQIQYTKKGTACGNGKIEFFDPHFHVVKTPYPNSKKILDPPHGGPIYSIQDYEKSLSPDVELIGGVIIEAISDHPLDEAKFFEE
jgi:hypothetical protein